MLERQFQASLIKEIKSMFPECIIIKNDCNYIQGFPDLTILFDGPFWAVLESKRDETASHRPNQDYYIDILDRMSFSRLIYPENKEEVLSELQQAFCS